MAAPSDDKSLALYCDFENIALGVRDAKYRKFDINHILERLLVKGSIVVKKAYCDWERYKNFKAKMHEAAFELIEIPHVRQSGKNSADIRMVVDALDLCYTKSHVDTFVIISGDSDFSPLVSKLRENAKTVIGVGVKNSTSDLLISSCDEFIYYDDLVREIERARSPTRKRASKKRASRAANGQQADEALSPDAESGDGAGPEGTDEGSGKGREESVGRGRGRGRGAKAKGSEASDDAENGAGGDEARTDGEETPNEEVDDDAAASKKGGRASKKKARSRRTRRASTATVDGEGVGDGEAGPSESGEEAPEAVADAADDGSLPRDDDEAPSADGLPDEEAEEGKAEELAQEGLDLVLETALALSSERGGADKLWGSMIKQTLKRRRPGFNESYYGFDSFGRMLEEAAARGYLALEHDDRSGGYIITTIST